MKFFSACAHNFNLNCSVIAVFTNITAFIWGRFNGIEIKMDETLNSELMGLCCPAVKVDSSAPHGRKAHLLVAARAYRTTASLLTKNRSMHQVNQD